VFYQHLLRPVISAVLADANISVKLKYRSISICGNHKDASILQLFKQSAFYMSVNYFMSESKH